MAQAHNMRRARRVLGALLGLLLLFFLLLHTSPVRRFALRQAVVMLERQGVQFDAADLRYNLLNLTATLENVTVRSPHAPDLPALLRADQVKVDLGLARITRGSYHIEDAVITNPRLHIVVEKDGRTNVPRPPAKPDETPSKEPIDYLVEKLLVSGGSVQYEDRRWQLAAALPIRELAVAGQSDTGLHDIRLQGSGEGRLTFENRTLPVRGARADVRLRRDGLDIRDLRLALGDSTLAVAGRLNDFQNVELNLTADATVALGPWIQFAGVDRKVEGTMEAALALDGPLARVKVSGRLEGQNLRVETFDSLSLKSQLDYDAAASRVRMHSVSLSSPLGAVRGHGDVALNAKAGASSADLAAEGLDLEQLSGVLNLPVRIASRADGRAAARWPGLEIEKATGDAAFRLSATRSAPAQDVVPVAGAFDVKAQSDRLTIAIPGLEVVDTTTTGEIALTNRQTLGGELSIHAPSLSATIAAAERILGSKTGLPVEGSLNCDIRLGGTVQSPGVAATLKAPDLQAGELRGISIEAAGDFTSKQLTVGQAAVQWREQVLNGTGTVDFSGPEPALDLAAHAKNLSIESVLAGLNRGDLPMGGNVAFETQIRGTAKNPQADLKLAATDVVAYQERLGSLTVQGQLRNRGVQISSDGLLSASGSYDLDTKSYSLRANTRTLRLSSLTLPDGAPVRGEIDLSASGQGSTENPAADVKLAVADLTYGEKQFGSIDVTAQVANRQAEVAAAAPRFHLSAKGTIGTRAPYPTTFEVTADNTDLATLPVQVDPPLKGTVSARVQGSGELANYAQGQVSADVSQLELEWNGQPIWAEGPLRASYSNQVLELSRAVIAARDSRISVEGSVPLRPEAGEGSIHLSAKLDLPSVASYLPTQHPIELGGTATIEGDLRGTLRRIDPAVTITLQNGYALAPQLKNPISNATLRAEARDGALELQNASFLWGPASFQASGTVPFALFAAKLPIELPSRTGPAQFTAEVKAPDLKTLGGPENLSGTVSARLEAQAARPEMEAITGAITFPQLRLGLGTYTLAQKGISQILLDRGTLRVGQFALTGPSTEIRLAGSAGLMGQQALQLRLDGTMDASILRAFSDTVRASGATKIQAEVSGTVRQPQAQGHVQLSNASFSLQQPRLAAENLNLRVDLAGSRASVSQLEGFLNGGWLSGGGALEYSGGQLRNTDLKLKGESIYLDFPEGLKTVSDVLVQVRNQGDGVVIGGEVVIAEGGFTDDLNFDRGILAAISSPRSVELTEERNRGMERIRFNLPVRTENPLVIDNNLAKAEVALDLRLLGNPSEPGLSGRLTIEPDGELRLQERRYVVERGEITFTSDREIEPNLDILATTSVEGYDIQLQISGQPGKTETTLTSDPPLPETDILALLTTGRTIDELRGHEFEVARDQVLSYLTGRVGSTLGGGVESATGLSSVRIEPNLIAAETDPSARLTVGQDITRNLDLIYSMDLVNSSDQIYVAEYDITRRFTTRGVRQSDGSFRMDFRHDLRFGGAPEPRRGAQREQRRIGKVSILGNPFFPPEKVAAQLAKPGTRYDFFDLRKRLDRIRRRYERGNRLEANVRLNREQRTGTVDLALEVEAGPQVHFIFEGIGVPGGVQKQVREVWRDGVFETQRAEEAIAALKTWLVKEGYLQAEMECSISAPAPDRKQVLFDIRPGPRFAGVELAFDGAKAMESATLREVLQDQNIETEVYTKPSRVRELLARYYQEKGYLEAAVGEPNYRLDAQARTGQVVFPIKEGALFRVGRALFEGNKVVSESQLEAALPVPKGEAYAPVLRENALRRLREAYWERGYIDVDVEMVTRRDPKQGVVDLLFQIVENRRNVVQEIIVEGNRNTSEELIRSQLEIRPGDVLDLRKVGSSRQSLYKTGAYSTVEITREEIDSPGADKALRLRVSVREIQPFEVRYGGFYDTERGPGGIVDVSNRNSLGNARVLGLRTRYDSQLHEARLYFSQPMLRRFPVKTILSPFVRREINPATEETDPFNVDRVGISLQQEAGLRNHYLLNYGYRFERSRTYDTGPEAFFDVPLRLAFLTATLSRESRDEILDASRGSFLSHAVEYAPTLLGSDLGFIKYFGQYFKYFPLQKPRVQLFTNEVLRPRLVYATGVRVGLSKGFGETEVPLSERFFAGGGTTIRGFEQNTVGQVLAGRVPLGGEGMLVINNELRFPVVSIFDGVGFVDIGNVYRNVSDFSLTDVRKAAGVGLRLRTPWFLLRLDYGFKLDRRPEESRSRWFFSIGQAF